MNRRIEREQAFILIFEKEFNPEASIDDIFKLALDSGFMEPSDFSKKLASLTVENLEFIDGVIEKYAVGWSISRITKVSLSILRIALCEINFMDDIPVGVSINEAVELAKRYAGKEDSAFINGILGTVTKAAE